MKRKTAKIGAGFGALALAAGPALAGGDHATASARSLQIAVAGNTAASQSVTATNDGSGQKTAQRSTVPDLAGIAPGNSLLKAGVAPQAAGANSDGTSYACAGIAGTADGDSIARAGTSSCSIKGKALTLDLGSLDLGTALIGQDSSLGASLNTIPGIQPVLVQATKTTQQILGLVDDQLGKTPLGEIKLGGSLGAVQGICTATPSRATGTANIADTSGGSNNTPITLTLPGGRQIVLADLPANPKPNTHVLTNLDSVTQSVIDAVKVELQNAVGGVLSGQGFAGSVLQQTQDQIIAELVKNLQPALKPLQANVLDITLNKQVASDGGRRIEVTALDGQVLPIAKQATGSSLVSLKIGDVTCGPNQRAAAPAPTKAPPAHHPAIPLNVDSGVAGDAGGHEPMIAALASLLAIGAVSVTLGYRRMRRG